MQAVDRELPRSAADIPVEVYARPGGTERSDAAAKATQVPPGHVGVTAGPSPPHKMCVVCQQVIDYDALVKLLVCSHVCHADCADRWLRSELHCPLCKNQVVFPVALPTMHGGVLPPTRLEGSLTAMRTVPMDGTQPCDYGVCRGCHEVFYRNPAVVKPETNAFYRCPNCRSYDVVSMLRASCLLQ